MIKTKETRLAVLSMSIVLVFSLLLGLLSFQGKAKLMAKGTVEAVDEVRTFFIQNNGANILTSGFAEYWNDNGATL